VDELVRRGHIACLARRPFFRQLITTLSQILKQDLRSSRAEGHHDIEDGRKAIGTKGAEYVLHLAARTSVPLSVKVPHRTTKLISAGTPQRLGGSEELTVKFRVVVR